jgi:hypothetical protein
VPLVAAAYLAFVAGLLATYGGAAGAVALATAGGVGRAALARDARLLALALTLAAGALVARAELAERARCAARLAGAHRRHVVVAEPVLDDGFARALLRDGDAAARRR